jgi:hypothetical protein
MNAAHAERVAEIDSEFDGEIAENDKRWNEVKAKVLELRKDLVKVDAEGKPVRPVTTDFEEAWQICLQPNAEDLQEACKGDLRKKYWEAFGRRYYKADLEAVDRDRKDHPEADLEGLAAHSHNSVLNAYIKENLATIARHKADFRDTMNSYRADRIRMSGEQRDHEIEAADRKRRAIWAAAFQGFAQGMQQASQTSSNRSSYVSPSSPSAAESGCTSDYSCGPAQTCVKQFYNSTGVCMRKVNEYGGPSYSPPDLDSVGPNMPDSSSCTRLGASCPAGFRCDYSSGRCIK